MREILDVTGKLIVDYRARGEWCRLPYPNHPKGCPNYGKKFMCPPNCPKINEWCDLSSKMWLVCVPFNIEEHANNMKLAHPHWTDRQVRCLLYWQPKVNKELAEATYFFASHKGADVVLNGVAYCPEAMGVNVIQTARDCGLPIEVHPQKIVYKISLVVG